MGVSSEQNPFWNFSLHHYATPGVAGICLTLQDKAGLSVNRLLFCLWLAERGRLLEMEPLNQSEALRQCHEQVLTPLRNARYGMKRIGMSVGQPKLYLTMKQTELEVERIEQKLLLRLAHSMSEDNRVARELARVNFETYLASLSVDILQWSTEVERLIDLVLGEKDNKVFFIGAND
ncbi:MAG: TIGR02444 family protein [Pseudomonadales bacterium]|nr:TIGR02444 family protein [Pseudomonadales bacterium]